MTNVSIFRGGGFGNLAGWYYYFFGTIIRHTRVMNFGCNNLFLVLHIIAISKVDCIYIFLNNFSILPMSHFFRNVFEKNSEEFS